MSQRFSFEQEQDFMDKLRELLHSGTDPKRIELHMPYPPHGIEELMGEKESWVRFFSLGGAVTGFLTGLGFASFTALWWPLITGGKPILSLPPYLLIGYILTILFGALATFGGFLLLARMPSVKRMTGPEQFGNEFVIEVEGETP